MAIPRELSKATPQKMATTTSSPTRPQAVAPGSASSTASKAKLRQGLRRLFIGVLKYTTNHIVAHIPSWTIRHFWYSRVLGVELAEHAGVHMGCYLYFNGPGSIRRTRVQVGQNSRINRDCHLDLRGGLTIGANVSLSAAVAVLTSAGMSNSSRDGEVRRVTIEDNAWIGVRAIIMPGVTVGRGAVVGAGAIVMRDVPPFAIVFGSPARAVGSRSPDEADYVLGGPWPLFE